jgi:sugar/nucleoside kinase (ribokinase family)
MSINFIGDIFLDIIAKDITRLPAWETDTLASISMIAGGSCLNSVSHAKSFADYLNLQGKPTNIGLNLFSSVGLDSQGAICLDHLTKVGLLTDNIAKLATERTGTCIVLSGSSDRCFVTDRGCIDSMSIELFDHNALLDCQHFHFAGFYNCAELRNDVVDLFRKVFY